MKNSILHYIYAIYEKNVEQENCSFQKDLYKFRTFFHRSYIFCLWMKNINKNKTKLFLSKPLHEIRKKFW